MTKCTNFAGHFDGRGGAPVWYRTHRPMEEIQGFGKSQWMLPPPPKNVDRLISEYVDHLRYIC